MCDLLTYYFIKACFEDNKLLLTTVLLQIGYTCHTFTVGRGLELKYIISETDNKFHM